MTGGLPASGLLGRRERKGKNVILHSQNDLLHQERDEQPPTPAPWALRVFEAEVCMETRDETRLSNLDVTRPANMGRACNRKAAPDGPEAGLPSPVQIASLGAGLDSALTQRPQQATITHPTRTQEPRPALALGGHRPSAASLRPCGPSAGRRRAVESLAGRWPPLPRQRRRTAGHPQTQTGQGGASTRPRPRRWAARCTSRPPYGKPGGTRARGVPVWCAHSSDAGPDDAPGSGGCGGWCEVAPRAVVQPPSPLVHVLSTRLQGWSVLPGFSEPLPAASGQVCVAESRHSWADGLGLTLL